MKREFNIKVMIDTDDPNMEGKSSEANVDQTGAGNHKIYIRRQDGQTGEPTLKPLYSLAHELGHVLASEFDLPGYSHDPRAFVLNALFSSPTEQGINTYRAEKEAWDVAEEILTQKNNALSTYARAAIVSEINENAYKTGDGEVFRQFIEEWKAKLDSVRKEAAHA